MVMDDPTNDTGRDLPRDAPRVIVAQRVIEKIKRGALLYPEPETGEAMIGLVVPQQGRPEPDIYILDTISPGERAVREWGMFEQGDDWQGDVFHWLYVNWEAFRELRRASYGNALAGKWDVPLAHVGDWHKQPGDMVAPSGGDAATARRMIEDRETPIEQLVVPIVTLYPLTPEPVEPAAPAVEGREPAGEAAPQPGKPPLPPNAIVLRDEAAGWEVRIDFWYMSRRKKKFVPVTPVVWEDERLPGLPSLAWHLAHPHRFDQEYRLLIDDGYTVDVVRWDADGRPPYEICFAVHKESATHVLLLITSADYPYEKPALRIAPLVSVAEGEDQFEQLYAASRPLLLTEMPTWEWDSKRTLVELARHFEETEWQAQKKDGGR